ncbi:Ribonuclease HI [Halanaerobium saccharolyticum subsp. saccharolyticum DSM 6643]|uniref:Ribonuclease H n=1 Tax=Halanaerobium saccharolyticum subsp. saccharolyticum DSM 6643 TaxID=1293054 RepID=M5E1B2_9FIRM|nr:ribonuclease HI [Halanaerobium saccharolyticum]CCU79579.1 Ribonuclease HI [Halanaerobium saccharolyticum subsp. saccharolyticum DSM 6643]
MSKKEKEFNQFRQKMNDIILEEGDLNTKRFFNLDTNVYKNGKLSAKTKELLGLAASMVLRCDDCITYHIIEAYQAGWDKEEIYEAMNVALIIGGSIVIPHMRRAAELLEELDDERNNVEFEALEVENLEEYNEFKVYTDGACIGNPGPGGYAAVILNSESEKLKTVSGSAKDSTNNRMELKAVIEALKILPKNSTIDLYSDSSYVLNGLSSWIESWKKNGWKTSSKKEVANQDLWQELDNLAANFNLNYQKVKGHSGDFYNEEVDKLAKKEAEKN